MPETKDEIVLFVDGKNVIVINDLSSHMAELGQKIVILGGGQAGCEAAIHLADEGKTVVLVEMQNELAADANKYQKTVLNELLRGCVESYTGHKGTRINDEGLYCTDPDGKEIFIAADTIILATGQRARKQEADSLLDAAPLVYQIGDCVTPKDMTTAIYQGFHAALDI